MRLTLNGSALKSIEGKYAIRLVKVTEDYYDGTVRDEPAVIVSVNGADRAPLLVFNEHLDVVWGPKDSGFAVIRSSRDDGSSYMAVELKRGKCLRSTH
jgi:hypothetical protein